MDVEDHIKAGLRALYVAAQSRVDGLEPRRAELAGQIKVMEAQGAAIEREQEEAKSVMYRCVKLGESVGLSFGTKVPR